ncbi:CTD nuclear envelope phosphatase 1 [Physocladia obscura]|uniref:Mitochondrial import inner membrane translocase subunit TIM50 n=1 Tax=Physocladia obscura TaxID=109957 RepID=A0AAD5T9L5_9FUNG|nr:CTD nuclear envelope phosphatase 1 [Physocladia obscura]
MDQINAQQQRQQQYIQQNLRDRDIALLRRRTSTASITTGTSPNIPHLAHLPHLSHLNHLPDDSFSSTESMSTTDFTTTGTDTDVSDSPSAAAVQKKRLVKRRRKLPSKSSELAKTKLSASYSYYTNQGLSFSIFSWLWWPFSWFGFSSASQSKRQSQQKPAQYKLPPKKTLVLDLDETLVHSTSTGSRHHDHIIEVLVDKHVCLYYVYKRPGVDAFLKKVSQSA